MLRTNIGMAVGGAVALLFSDHPHGAMHAAIWMPGVLVGGFIYQAAVRLVLHLRCFRIVRVVPAKGIVDD